jgi:ribA/ribD-fused uncharacterized protein
MGDYETSKNGFYFFWKGILSQWHPTPIVDPGNASVIYKTAEHWMMWHKAIMFNDYQIAQAILEAETPQEVKKLGRQVHGFTQEDWDMECFGIVVSGNRLKFSQNEKARNHLLSTGTTILVEASLYDKIWGIGMAQDDYRATNPAMWPGKNLLGLALMTVRNKLRETL